MENIRDKIAGIEKPEDRIERLQKWHDESEDRIKTLAKENRRQTKAYGKLNRDFTDLTTDSENLRKELELKEAQIAALQGEHFEVKQDTGYSQAEDDNLVRDKIKQCTEEWRSWSGKYAVQSLSIIRQESRKDIELLFSKCSNPDARLSVDASFAGEPAAKAPKLILYASLAKLISDAIIQHAFFSLEVPASPGTDSIARDLNFVYELAQKGESLSC